MTPESRRSNGRGDSFSWQEFSFVMELATATTGWRVGSAAKQADGTCALSDQWGIRWGELLFISCSDWCTTSQITSSQEHIKTLSWTFGIEARFGNCAFYGVKLDVRINLYRLAKKSLQSICRLILKFSKSTFVTVCQIEGKGRCLEWRLIWHLPSSWTPS